MIGEHREASSLPQLITYDSSDLSPDLTEYARPEKNKDDHVFMLIVRRLRSEH